MILTEDFEKYINLSPTLFFKWEAKEGWPILYVTENVLQTLGYTKDEFLSGEINYASLIHSKDLSKVTQEVTKFSNTNVSSFNHTPYRIVTKDKQIIWVDDYTQIVRDENGNAVYYFGYIRDITHFKTITQNLEAYQQMLNTTSMITISDPTGNIIYANERFLENSGYRSEELLGKSHNIFRHPDTPKEVFETMWHQIKHKKTWKGMIKSKRKNGSVFYADITIIPFLNSKGKIEKYIGIRHDVTPLIEATNTLKEQSQKDNLTGLGNRFKLLRDINDATLPFLALFDIARFGEINDFYGYKIGDNVIITLAQKLNALTHENCKLYRINADEFALLADNVTHESFYETIITLHANLNQHALHVGDKDIIITLVAGLSCEIKSELLITADLAKNHAKNSHSLFCLYSREIELSKEYERNIFWASCIKKALEEDKIVPFYQPIYDNTTQCIDKYEALVRIIDGDKIISPIHFLEIAKKTHQYLSITKKVIDKSFAYFMQNDKTLSINLTIEDIIHESLREYLWNASHTYNMGKRLVLEIVESESIKNFDSIQTFLDRAKKCECKLAIDDFGTGYSNFEYLIKLQADYIKIDGSIIKNINVEDGTLDVIKAIVSFAKARGMKTVAEFVSTKEIFDTVCSLGIDYSQGYYIGEPKPFIL